MAKGGVKSLLTLGSSYATVESNLEFRPSGESAEIGKADPFEISSFESLR